MLERTCALRVRYEFSIFCRDTADTGCTLLITESSAAFIYFRIYFADCGGILFNSFSLKFAECGVCGARSRIVCSQMACGLRTADCLCMGFHLQVPRDASMKVGESRRPKPNLLLLSLSFPKQSFRYWDVQIGHWGVKT